MSRPVRYGLSAALSVVAYFVGVAVGDSRTDPPPVQDEILRGVPFTVDQGGAVNCDLYITHDDHQILTARADCERIEQ